MKELLSRFIKEEDGQGMTEYGLILALVAVVAVATLTVMGESVRDIFNKITGDLGGDMVDITEEGT